MGYSETEPYGSLFLENYKSKKLLEV